jgi:hypothetical protein
MKSYSSNSANRIGLATRKHLAIALALTAFTTAGVAPALAAAKHYHHPAHARLRMYAPEALAQGPSGATRDAAIHECSVNAAKYSSSAWQTTQFATYETCMAEHGQVP